MPNAYSRHPATMTPEPPTSASFLAFLSCSSLDPILVGDDAECVVGPLTVNNNNPGDFVSSSGNFFDLASYFSAVLRLDQRGLNFRMVTLRAPGFCQFRLLGAEFISLCVGC